MSVGGITVRCVNLPDDELWRAIAENTNAMSALVDQQLEIDEIIGAADPPDRARLLGTYLDTINQFQRECRDCSAELRRRYNITQAEIALPRRIRF